MLKTNFHSIFTEWFQIQKGFTTPFEETSPQELNDLFVGKKMRRTFGHLRAKIVIVGSSNWVKIIIFVPNYLTVLVYTKTIIHLSVGG